MQESRLFNTCVENAGQELFNPELNAPIPNPRPRDPESLPPDVPCRGSGFRSLEVEELGVCGFGLRSPPQPPPAGGSCHPLESCNSAAGNDDARCPSHDCRALVLKATGHRLVRRRRRQRAQSIKPLLRDPKRIKRERER